MDAFTTWRLIRTILVIMAQLQRPQLLTFNSSLSTVTTSAFFDVHKANVRSWLQSSPGSIAIIQGAQRSSMEHCDHSWSTVIIHVRGDSDEQTTKDHHEFREDPYEFHEDLMFCTPHPQATSPGAAASFCTSHSSCTHDE